MKSLTFLFKPQLPAHHIQDSSMGLRGRTLGIDYRDSVRLAFGDGHVPFADSRKKRARFLLETIFVAMAVESLVRRALVPAAGPADADGWIGIQQDRQIRLQISAQHSMQFEDWVAPQLPAAALVSFG